MCDKKNVMKDEDLEMVTGGQGPEDAKVVGTIKSVRPLGGTYSNQYPKNSPTPPSPSTNSSVCTYAANNSTKKSI